LEGGYNKKEWGCPFDLRKYCSRKKESVPMDGSIGCRWKQFDMAFTLAKDIGVESSINA
jgi:hypothetical protein